MDTKALVKEYRRLLATGDLAGAEALVDTNSKNQLFLSLVGLRKVLIPAMVEKFTVEEAPAPKQLSKDASLTAAVRRVLERKLDSLAKDVAAELRHHADLAEA